VSNNSKAAGTRWETAVVGYLRSWWPTIDRRPLSGRYDRGDIKYGPRAWTIECKNEAKIRLPFYMRQAAVEATNNGDPWYVAVVRNRRGRLSSGTVADAFAVLPLRLWAQLTYEHERAEVMRQEALAAVPCECTEAWTGRSLADPRCRHHDLADVLVDAQK
jgi:hypothetical protein